MRLQSLEKLEFRKIKEYLAKEARTELGRLKIKELTPHTDISFLEKESQKLKAFVELFTEEGRPPIPSLSLLGPLVRRAEKGGLLTISQAQLVRRYLYTAKDLSSYLSQKKLSPLEDLRARLPRITHLRRFLDTFFDEKGLRPDASPRLFSLKKAQVKAEERLRKRLDELLKKFAKAGFLQEELVTQRRGRFCFPVKAEAKAKVPGILHDVSASGATVFIEPLEIVQITNEIEALKREEEREIERILREVSEEIAQNTAELIQLEETLAEIDILSAKALFAERIKGHLPAFKEDGALVLREAAHPLLLLAGREVVRNDFVFPSEKPVVVISGPNMGGKTVALKTVGLLVVMAQSLIPIPASSASEIPIFEGLFVDIGDEQDLAANESSFSAHVKNLKEALSEAGPRRLFLLDEIGRGTAPEEGAALAMAVLEELYRRGARVIATTHYEALKAFSFAKDWILPLAVSFDEKTGKPTYRFLYGVAGLSQGLTLAKRLGLPEDLINRAHSYLSREDRTFKEVLENLRLKLEELSREKKALEKEKAALQREKERLVSLEKELKEKFAAKEAALTKEFEEKIIKLTEDFKRFLAELKSRKVKEKKASEEFSSFIREKTREIIPDDTEKEAPLTPGARVKLKRVGQEGRLLRVKDNVCEVQVGPFRVEVHPKELIVLTDEKQPKRSTYKVAAETEAQDAINLIGLTVDEALPLLEKALDTAFLQGKTRLTIIHGLGTGRLMRAVRSFLKGHAQVASMRPGESFEGGEAVTIVELATKEEAV
ncbi:endonuclease MutS2 [Thermodesulfatator atlanticus]|uniref:endonuclease MutS2 n=1 Tax=Thermodesulfatator atlanticus TaxID=501497 RepID=UPI0003B35CB2|nr:endonuclease MutS2 [Thermodesulfatator atlanticus]